MAAPTSYTESSLISYMRTVTQAVSDTLGLNTGAFQEAVNDVLAAYGVSDIADATDITKLRVLAKVAAWRTVNDWLVTTAYDFSADGGSYKLSQMKEGAEKALQMAEGAAAEAGYTDAYAIQIGTLTRPYDPYLIKWQTEELEQN